eukprot:CAMPEP_0172723608 /NCGR_PEP_ID=MMETSP1074-20121228/84104_1 /TAXON_ID=2916 /ORGANISM="Ceratium fusus, Strain PA161109" /LENGTH=299 /DNA_ID=CAMNT_0013549885 /DNA_START=11 /DNA_END=911 /DNA_ORIENTATION=-
MSMRGAQPVPVRDGLDPNVVWEYVDPHTMQPDGAALGDRPGGVHRVSGVGRPLQRIVGGPRGNLNHQGRHAQAAFGRIKAFTDSFKCLPSCFDDECGVDLSDDRNSHIVASRPEPDDEVAVLFEPLQGEPLVYTIAFDRSHGVSLGLDVECSQGAMTLPVVAVKKVGLAAQWNRMNPDKAVVVGDEMLEVNGIRHNVEQMMAICKNARYIEVVLDEDEIFPDADEIFPDRDLLAPLHLSTFRDRLVVRILAVWMRIFLVWHRVVPLHGKLAMGRFPVKFHGKPAMDPFPAIQGFCHGEQ